MNRQPDQIIHPTREELEDYLKELIPELTLRLLLERERKDNADICEMVLSPERMYVVDQITIISYEAGRKKTLPERIRHTGRRMIQSLMEHAGTFLQKLWK